jgi:hypothetical protein
VKQIGGAHSSEAGADDDNRIGIALPRRGLSNRCGGERKRTRRKLKKSSAIHDRDGTHSGIVAVRTRRAMSAGVQGGAEAEGRIGNSTQNRLPLPMLEWTPTVPP